MSDSLTEYGLLPASPLTSFIGRKQEIAAIKRLLANSRLLTLTGTGGIGKTRLALHAASDLRGHFRDGVWWVELAGLTEPAQVLQAVALVLGIEEQGQRSLKEALQDHLRHRKILLILDNCEHLVTACAQLAEALLQTCRELQLLTTSREALKITGETTWQTPPLSISNLAHLSSLKELMQYEALQLFVERAMSVLPSFTLTQEIACSMMQVCCFLEGIPLAIELAAARMKILSIEQINARLDDCCRLLTGGSRIALPRQQAIRATIDWSYNLLSEQERKLLPRLAVFVGSFSLEAVEAICAGNGLEKAEMLDLVSNLVDKSLIVVEKESGELRYRFQEPIRQYSQKKLLQEGEEVSLRMRHRDWYLELAMQAHEGIKRAEQKIWVKWVEREENNLKAAFQWACEQGEAELVAQLLPVLRCITMPYEDSSPSTTKLASRGEKTRPVLRLFALGPTRLYREERALSSADWKYAKSKELLCYLLCHRQRTKEQIGLALWPDASQVQLRNNLHACLYHLRQALGQPEWITFENGFYAFNRQLCYWFDVEVFEELVTEAQRLQVETPTLAIHKLEEAIKLYRGDFLEDTPTGDWYILRQRELKKKYMDILFLLGRLFFVQKQYAQAIDVYCQLVAYDGFLEAAHREIIRCYALLGERGQALRHYQTLAHMMRSEFGSPPAPESIALFEHLRKGEIP